MGPLSRAVLAELTETDLSPKAFPFFTVKEIDIGSVSSIRAMNLTHTGNKINITSSFYIIIKFF